MFKDIFYFANSIMYALVKKPLKEMVGKINKILMNCIPEKYLKQLKKRKKHLVH